MMLNKHTETLLISDFVQLIPNLEYPKFFTPNEIYQYANKRSKGSLAARYLLKKITIAHFEQSINFTDIEILNNDLGKPEMKFNNNDIQNSKIHFSLSHTKEVVAAFVIFE